MHRTMKRKNASMVLAVSGDLIWKHAGEYRRECTVENPQHVDANRVRHLAVQFDANPDPAFRFDVHPDPAFPFDADPVFS